MQIIIQRFVWSLVWGVVIAIAIALNLDMAQEQPILFALVAVCLLVVGIALYYTFSHFNARNYGEALVTLIVGVLCLGVVIISEFSFWSSSIESVQAQIEREQARAKGIDLVHGKRREQLAQAAANKLPGQIEAEMAEAGARELPALRAQLKAAQQLQQLQGQIMADSTEVVATDAVKRTFFKAAQIGSAQLGGSVQDWVAGIVVWMVLTMTMLHLAALYVGFAPVRREAASQRRQDRPTAPKTISATEAGTIVVPKAAVPVLTVGDTPEDDPKDPPPPPRKEPVPDKPKPDRPELDKQPELPPLPKPVRLAVANDFLDEETGLRNGNAILKAERRERQAKRARQAKPTSDPEDTGVLEGDPLVWAASCMVKKPGANVTSARAHRNFAEKYCAMFGYEAKKRKAFTAAINKWVNQQNGVVRSKGERNPRNGQCTVWWDWDLVEPETVFGKLQARA